MAGGQTLTELCVVKFLLQYNFLKKHTKSFTVVEVNNIIQREIDGFQKFADTTTKMN